MGKTKIILIGADPDLYVSLARLFSQRGIEVHIPTSMRGSSKIKMYDEYLCGLVQATQLPADQFKGPKGPRTKWGKLV